MHAALVFYVLLTTSVYALALVVLPFGFHHDTGQLTVTTALADDDGGGGDDGGSSGGGDDGGSGDVLKWNRAELGLSGATTPTATFKLASGGYCRQYVQQLNRSGEISISYLQLIRILDSGTVSPI